MDISLKKKKLKILGLIPTRLNSQRLPQKALMPINGIPLVVHTYKRAKLSKKLEVARMISGGEFFVRYVPQSRYFQNQELDITEDVLTNKDLKVINDNQTLIKKFEILTNI